MNSSYKQNIQMIGRFLFLPLFFWVTVGTAFSQNKSNPVTEKTVRAYRIPPNLIKIDGRLDEPVWGRVKSVSDFIQYDPIAGEPATKKSIVKIVYDRDAIYVAFKAYDENPGAIVSYLTRRDNYTPSDWIGIAFDSYNDKRTAFAFMVNPSNVKIDYKTYNDDYSDFDYNWDAIWDVKTAIYTNGWVAEFCIPLSQLRFSNGKNMEWGFQAWRVISRLNESDYWVYRPKETKRFVSIFGKMVGLRKMNSYTGVKYIPYAKSVLDYATNSQKHDKIPNPQSSTAIGLDAKVPLSNNYTVDLTINPDFGQVESDPSVFNLTAYETYFDERRPFFMESSDLFYQKIGIGNAEMEGGRLFYSRRIGRTPHSIYTSSPSLGVQQDPATTILGAGKLTGKSSNGWSIGIMNAITGQESATLYSGNIKSNIVTEPLTNYAVARVQKDYNKGQSVLGGILTNVIREQGTSLAQTLASTATTGGINFTHGWENSTYEIDMSLMGSHITGDTTAIQNAQLSSARYFQRPNADHVSYDPTRTSMSGMAAKLNFRKFIGQWRWAMGGVSRSPGFEVNDMGYMQRTDFNSLFFWTSWRDYTPGKVIRYYDISTQVWRYFDYSITPLGAGMFVSSSVQLLNYWYFYFYLQRNQRGLDPYLLRGGEAFAIPGNTQFMTQMSTDARKPFHYTIRVTYNVNDQGFENWSVMPTITVRPPGRSELVIALHYDHGVDDLQYITPFAGSYVLGQLDRKNFYSTIRANFTITPNLSLQYYGMPYISAGHYNKFHLATDPRAVNYNDRMSNFSNSSLTTDFNYKQYRSNVVIRWEYNPGSTLFFVWSQGITQYDLENNFQLDRNISTLLKTHPNNVFLLKISKWFNL